VGGHAVEGLLAARRLGGALAEIRERRVWYLPKPFEVERYLDLVSLLVGAK